MVLFLGGFFAFVMWCVTRLGRNSNNSKRTPVEIVRERYAKGEITKEQFDQICRDLSLETKTKISNFRSLSEM